MSLFFTTFTALLPIIFSSRLFDAYNDAKHYFFNIGTCVFLIAHRKHLDFSWVKNRVFVLFLLTTIGCIAFHQFYSPTVSRDVIISWLCFFLFMSIRWNLSPQELFKNISRTNTFSTVLVLIYGFTQILGYEPFTLLPHNEYPTSFLGFQNATAQFLSISILIQIFTVSYAKLPLMIASFCHLLFLDSRASLIALFVALLFYGCFSPTRWRKTIWITASVFIMLATSLLTYKFVTDPNWKETKTVNFTMRQARWLNTVQMIKENPMGVGLGNFEFEYLKYKSALLVDPQISEEETAKSPHNGYLELLVELGILPGLLFLFWFLTQFKNFYGQIRLRAKTQGTFEPLSVLTASFFVFIIVCSLFDFVLELPYPFFMAALFGGILLQKISTQNRFSFRVGAYAISVGIFTLTVFSTTSNYLNYRYPGKYDLLKLACKLDSDFLEACMGKAELEMRMQTPEAAQKTLSSILSKQPNYFPAIKLLAYAEKRLGHQEPYCAQLKRYEDLFHINGRESSVFAEYSRDCTNMF